MKIGGLDIGTTGCKLTVFDETGRELDRAYQAYASVRGRGTDEIDAEEIRTAVVHVLREIGSRQKDIAGIGVTSFGETFVLTDDSGKPLHPALLYTDPHGEKQRKQLEERLGTGTIERIAGVKPHEMYSLPKIMWLAEEKPELFRQAKHIFLIEDFVVYALTGRAQIDYSLAARTMGFDIHDCCWSREIFAAAGIDVGLMSEPVPSGTKAGTLLPSAAQAAGLSPETVIVSAAHDQISAAVGAGAFTSDIAVDGAGTVECLTPVYDGVPDPGVMSAGSFAVVPYVIPGKYVCYAFSYTGGALIDWCVKTFAEKEKRLAKEAGCSVNTWLEQHSEGPTGLLVLPHFAGAATPYMDNGSRGAVLGLTLGTTTAELYRACMEGVAYEMRLNMEFLAPSGIRSRMLHATGGGAHSAVWMQMKADILNLPMTALQTADAGTAGGAMLTGTALGIWKNPEEAAGQLVKKCEVYTPDPVMHERYSAVYERYRRMYEAVRPLM